MTASSDATPPAARPRDTSEDALRAQATIYRGMTPARKLELVVELNRLADELALAGIAERHPDADAHERRMRLLVLKHGPELIQAAYGWSAGN